MKISIQQKQPIRMTPLDLQAAIQECQDLLSQGLIEPIQSNWACQAFYVEKKS